jgi:hypothetical protein
VNRGWKVDREVKSPVKERKGVKERRGRRGNARGVRGGKIAEKKIWFAVQIRYNAGFLLN